MELDPQVILDIEAAAIAVGYIGGAVLSIHVALAAFRAFRRVLAGG